MYNSLAVDIGNTRTKFGYFIDRELSYFDSFENELIVEKSKSLNEMQLDAIIISSVNSEVRNSLRLDSLDIKLVELDYTLPLPIQLKYQTPDTLGKDRIAAVVAAYKNYPNQANLVIDAGTCITYDIINQSGDYFGGAISPGIQLRLNAMNNGTSSLPLINWNANMKAERTGNSTINSMLSGVIFGIIGEINGFIKSYKSSNHQLNVIITGGDASFFEKELKNGIFADPNLVLKGLNEILLYNSE